VFAGAREGIFPWKGCRDNDSHLHALKVGTLRPACRSRDVLVQMEIRKGGEDKNISTRATHVMLVLSFG
jgi:hypothetical protein